VGKTSLVLRFIEGTFRDSYVPTIEDTYRSEIKGQKQKFFTVESLTPPLPPLPGYAPDFVEVL
jgi:GTPase SAR1 family protein